jgi:hypothetical protein
MAPTKGKPLLMACQPSCGRITRSQAAANRAMSAVPPSEPLPADTEVNQTARGQRKRGAVDEDASAKNAAISAPRPKKRKVLKDVTNICRGSTCTNCASLTKFQVSRSLVSTFCLYIVCGMTSCSFVPVEALPKHCTVSEHKQAACKDGP